MKANPRPTVHRRVPRVFWLLALLLPITCGPLDVISMTETSTTTIARATLFEQLVGDLGFGGFLNLDITQNTQLQNQGVERHQIDSVRATSLILTIIEPASGQDFSFMESITFYVEAPGFERVRIAHGADFPDGATQIDLSLDAVDLAPYTAAESMTVTSSVEGRRPDHETVIEAQITLDVDLNIGGVVCGA